MPTANEIITQVAAWKPEAVPLLEQVMPHFVKVVGEDYSDFQCLRSLEETFCGLMIPELQTCYIDAPQEHEVKEYAREMRRLQSDVYAQYGTVHLIINLERINPNLSDLLSFDLLKLAVLSQKLGNFYIIGTEEKYKTFVDLAMSIHKKVLDSKKFQHYESIEQLPQILKKIKRKVSA